MRIILLQSKTIRKIGIVLIVIWIITIIGGSAYSWITFSAEKGYVTFEDYYGNIIKIDSFAHLILITFQYPSLPVLLLVVGITLLLVSVKMKS